MNAEQLKKMRERHGWSQRDLARRCKLSVRTVQGWEGGRRIGGLAKAFLAILDERETAGRRGWKS